MESRSPSFSAREIDRSRGPLQFERGVAVTREQRCGHLLQDGQLLTIALPARRLSPEDGERLLVSADRHGMGKHSRRDIGRPAVVRHGPVGACAARVLVGQLR